MYSYCYFLLLLFLWCNKCTVIVSYCCYYGVINVQLLFLLVVVIIVCNMYSYYFLLFLLLLCEICTVIISCCLLLLCEICTVIISCCFCYYCVKYVQLLSFLVVAVVIIVQNMYSYCYLLLLCETCTIIYFCCCDYIRYMCETGAAFFRLVVLPCLTNLNKATYNYNYTYVMVEHLPSKQCVVGSSPT